MDNLAQKNVNALLGTATSKLLYAGELTNQMRSLNQEDPNSEKYWHTAAVLGEVLAIAGHCLTESHRILLAQMGVKAPGGIVH